MTGPDWSQVTVFFGGTFDPPHLGHRQALEGLRKLPGAARLVVIPSASPPHKACQASPAQRLEMARIAFDDIAGIEGLEIDRNARSQAPTYTFDTLQELGSRFPEGAFVIGTDQFLALPGWHRFPEVLSLA